MKKLTNKQKAIQLGRWIRFEWRRFWLSLLALALLALTGCGLGVRTSLDDAADTQSCALDALGRVSMPPDGLYWASFAPTEVKAIRCNEPSADYLRLIAENGAPSPTNNFQPLTVITDEGGTHVFCGNVTAGGADHRFCSSITLEGSTL